eukprot:10985657-Ditylum_brightwellii.AAC.1
MEKFGDYNLLRQLTSKEGALGVHTVTATEDADTYDWEEVMDNLAYAATASNTQLETLALHNKKKLTEDSRRLIQIIAKSVGCQPTTSP